MSTYLIDSQCITKMFRSFSSNVVVRKMECGQCLEEKGMESAWKVFVGVSLGLFAVHT